MKFTDRIKLSFKALRGEVDKENEYQKIIERLTNLGDATEYKKAEDFIKQGYQLNPHVYSVINYITKSISKIPFNVYKVVDEKAFKTSMSYKNSKQLEKADFYSKKALEPVEDKMLNDLVKNPNEFSTWETFIQQSIGYKLLTGNNYWYGLKPTGIDQITKIYNIPSQLVSIDRGASYLEPIKSYYVGLGGDQKEKLPVEQVCHRKFWNPEFTEESGNHYGMSPMMSLKNVVLRTNHAKEASLKLFESGMPAGILTNESGMAMTPEEVKAMEGQWNKKYGGGKNANKVMFASQAFKWQTLGMSSVDMQIMEAETADLRDICRVFGVPTVLISDNEQSSYNNILEAEKRYWSNTAIPEIEDFISDFNNFILSGYNTERDTYVIDYDVKAIPALQTDQATLSDRLLKEMNNGLWTPNQVRQMLEQEVGSEKHLNDYYINGSLKRIKNIEDF